MRKARAYTESFLSIRMNSGPGVSLAVTDGSSVQNAAKRVEGHRIVKTNYPGSGMIDTILLLETRMLLLILRRETGLLIGKGQSGECLPPPLPLPDDIAYITSPIAYHRTSYGRYSCALITGSWSRRGDLVASCRWVADIEEIEVDPGWKQSQVA